MQCYSVLKIYEHPILITSYWPMQKVVFLTIWRVVCEILFFTLSMSKVTSFLSTGGPEMNETQIDESIPKLTHSWYQNQFSKSDSLPLPGLWYFSCRMHLRIFYSPHNWCSWILQIFIMHSKNLLRTHQRFILNTPKYYMLCHSICRNSMCCCMQRGNTTNYKSLYLLPTLYLRVQAHISYCFVRCAHKISYNEYNV